MSIDKTLITIDHALAVVGKLNDLVAAAAGSGQTHIQSSELQAAFAELDAAEARMDAAFDAADKRDEE